jgi:hypothetical protein
MCILDEARGSPKNPDAPTESRVEFDNFLRQIQVFLYLCWLEGGLPNQPPLSFCVFFYLLENNSLSFFKRMTQ